MLAASFPWNDDLIRAVIDCKDNQAVRQVGIEWCIQQSKELKKQVFPFDYYSMGKSDNIKAIAEVFFRKSTLKQLG